jgi:predicted metal-dependent hydrolase
MSIPIDRLVRSRRRTVAIVIERDGSLTIRAPLRLAEARIRAFVESHAGWIEQTRRKVLASPPPPKKRYQEGEQFLYLGKPYSLSLCARQRPALTFDGCIFHMASSAQPEAEAAFTRWYREQARRLFYERVPVMAAKHNLHYEKIRISSARTRWGSCSSNGTLSFTYRLVMAPQEVVDYVILHELVHTQEHNHSKTFWARLAALMPDYKTRLNWLKKNGKILM